MKKYLLMPAFLFIAACSILFPVDAPAFQLGLGAYSYYNWREMAIPDDFENLEMESVLQVGPVISMTWANTISLSLSLLTNPYISHADFDYKPFVIDNETEAKTNYKVHVDDINISKTDIDLALSYAVSPRFKVFGGFKVLQMELVEGSKTLYTGTNQSDYSEITFHEDEADDDSGGNPIYRNGLLGAACGINYSFPVYDTLSLVTNASLLYFWSSVYGAPVVAQMNDGVYNVFKTGKCENPSNYYSPGANIALGLSYYIEAINTSISLGGRYQVVYNIYSSGDYKDSDGEFDHVWGVTCAAMYFLDFSGEE